MLRNILICFICLISFFSAFGQSTTKTVTLNYNKTSPAFNVSPATITISMYEVDGTTLVDQFTATYVNPLSNNTITFTPASTANPGGRIQWDGIVTSGETSTFLADIGTTDKILIATVLDNLNNQKTVISAHWSTVLYASASTDTYVIDHRCYINDSAPTIDPFNPTNINYTRTFSDVFFYSNGIITVHDKDDPIGQVDTITQAQFDAATWKETVCGGDSIPCGFIGKGRKCLDVDVSSYNFTTAVPSISAYTLTADSTIFTTPDSVAFWDFYNAVSSCLNDGGTPVVSVVDISSMNTESSTVTSFGDTPIKNQFGFWYTTFGSQNPSTIFSNRMNNLATQCAVNNTLIKEVCEYVECDPNNYYEKWWDGTRFLTSVEVAMLQDCIDATATIAGDTDFDCWEDAGGGGGLPIGNDATAEYAPGQFAILFANAGQSDTEVVKIDWTLGGTIVHSMVGGGEYDTLTPVAGGGLFPPLTLNAVFESKNPIWEAANMVFATANTALDATAIITEYTYTAGVGGAEGTYTQTAQTTVATGGAQTLTVNDVGSAGGGTGLKYNVWRDKNNVLRAYEDDTNTEFVLPGGSVPNEWVKCVEEQTFVDHCRDTFTVVGHSFIVGQAVDQSTGTLTLADFSKGDTTAADFIVAEIIDPNTVVVTRCGWVDLPAGHPYTAGEWHFLHGAGNIEITQDTCYHQSLFSVNPDGSRFWVDGDMTTINLGCNNNNTTTNTQDNIYTSDDEITEPRTLKGDNKSLTFAFVSGTDTLYQYWDGKKMQVSVEDNTSNFADSDFIINKDSVMMVSRGGNNDSISYALVTPATIEMVSDHLGVNNSKLLILEDAFRYSVNGVEQLVVEENKTTSTGVFDPSVIAYTPQDTVSSYQGIPAEEGWTVFRPQDKKIWAYSGTNWKPFGGGGVSTDDGNEIIFGSDDLPFLGDKYCYTFDELGETPTGIEAIHGNWIAQADESIQPVLAGTVANGKLRSFHARQEFEIAFDFKGTGRLQLRFGEEGAAVDGFGLPIDHIGILFVASDDIRYQSTKGTLNAVTSTTHDFMDGTLRSFRVRITRDGVVINTIFEWNNAGTWETVFDESEDNALYPLDLESFIVGGAGENNADAFLSNLCFEKLETEEELVTRPLEELIAEGNGSWTADETITLSNGATWNDLAAIYDKVFISVKETSWRANTVGGYYKLEDVIRDGGANIWIVSSGSSTYEISIDNITGTGNNFTVQNNTQGGHFDFKMWGVLEQKEVVNPDLVTPEPTQHGHWYTDGTGTNAIAGINADLDFSGTFTQSDISTNSTITFDGITWTLPAGKWNLEADLSDAATNTVPRFRFYDGSDFVGNLGINPGQAANWSGSADAKATIQGPATITLRAVTSGWDAAGDNSGVSSYVKIDQASSYQVISASDAAYGYTEGVNYSLTELGDRMRVSFEVASVGDTDQIVTIPYTFSSAPDDWNVISVNVKNSNGKGAGASYISNSLTTSTMTVNRSDVFEDTDNPFFLITVEGPK